MFSKLVPSLVALSALWGSHAAADGGVSYVLPGLGTGEAVTVNVLGTDSSGHTTYSLGFALPVTIASTATAPDTTITAAATLVDGSTDAHVFEIVTAGTEVVTYNEDCGLINGRAVCTIVAQNKATTISTAVTVTQSATGVTVVTASAAPKNGAARVGAAGTSLLAVAAGVVLAGAMM
ncbi:hypothetical protein LXA43DRAFT_385207 [Ganoderma leucocontextum]|nr:hypothetical protein LXA43DRAFT_385207 [Ganoderma leucocontextum]